MRPGRPRRLRFPAWASRSGTGRALYGIMRIRTRHLITAALLAIAGCGGSDNGGSLGPNPTLTGHWTGSGQLGQLDFEATFLQASGVVTGNGSYSSPIGGANFTVSGSVTGAAVSLTLEAGGVGTGTFTGEFTADDRVEGELSVPGSGSTSLTLRRD